MVFVTFRFIKCYRGAPLIKQRILEDGINFWPLRLLASIRLLMELHFWNTTSHSFKCKCSPIKMITIARQQTWFRVKTHFSLYLRESKIRTWSWSFVAVLTVYRYFWKRKIALTCKLILLSSSSWFLICSRSNNDVILALPEWALAVEGSNLIIKWALNGQWCFDCICISSI